MLVLQYVSQVENNVDQGGVDEATKSSSCGSAKWVFVPFFEIMTCTCLQWSLLHSHTPYKVVSAVVDEDVSL
jgi:hypothetical protein